MRLLLVTVLLAAALSGCVDAAGTDDAVREPLPDVDLVGQVRTPNFNPVEGAEVQLTVGGTKYTDGTQTEEGPTTVTATTDANGTFTVQVQAGNYPITIMHPDFKEFDSTVTVPQTNATFELQPRNVDIPYNDPFDFDGTIECAAEYVIITPSCDTLLRFTAESAGQDPSSVGVFQDDSVFELTTPTGWQTMVLDVRFDGTQYPGIAGLRSSAYAADADAEVFSYERIDQDWAGGDFSIRIDAGQDYGDAVPAPDSTGGDGLRFEFYPQGHGDDTACVPADSGLPEEGRCFLGVGVAQDLTFTATATLFVHEPAPQGWTTLAAS